MVDPRTPCVIGVAQRTWRETEAPEPLAMWAEVARAAAADTGAGAGDVLARLDSLQVVYCMSWPYDDPVARLAQRLGAAPDHRVYSGIGGTTPQVLVDDAAESILRGELDLALVVGGEALDTRRQLKRRGERPAWSHRNPDRPPLPLEAVPHPSEIAHQVFQAYLTFPLFDVARRAHLGVAPDAYRARLGRLLAPMTEVAAKNRHAWFPTARSAEEIVAPTAGNRMVGYPYTKYMVAVMDVDMAGALLVASEAQADALGVPRDRRVYLRGWAYGNDPWVVAERDEMWRSPGIEAVAGHALGQAGVGIDDVAYLDLYSCFASSVLVARDALGMADGDERPVTVTGGLPYAGGPASNYLLHSVATLVERLRDDPGSFGLVSGVGMHLTKHVYAAYATEPGPLAAPDQAALDAALAAVPRRAVVDQHRGRATLVAYTVEHARDGAPAWGLAVCELADGSRCYARVLDGGLLEELERQEFVGALVDLIPGDGGTNLVRA